MSKEIVLSEADDLPARTGAASCELLFLGRMVIMRNHSNKSQTVTYIADKETRQL